MRAKFCDGPVTAAVLNPFVTADTLEIYVSSTDPQNSPYITMLRTELCLLTPVSSVSISNYEACVYLPNCVGYSLKLIVTEKIFNLFTNEYSTGTEST